MATYRRSNRRYLPMDEDEVWDFAASRRKMVVAFAMPDGYAHATPVWFVTKNRKLYFRAADHKQKFRLSKGGKVCCVLEDGESYIELRGAVLWGRCRLVTSKRSVERVERLFDKKYRRLRWRPSQVPLWWIRTRSTERRRLVEVIPEKVSSWDNRKLSHTEQEPLHPQ